MKKEMKFLICLSLILVLSLSFTSAGWFGDFWGKITGEIIITTCTDQRNDIMIKEKCTNSLAEGGNILWDRCSGTNVQQVECVTGEAEEVCGYVAVQSCGIGYECSDGACVEDPTFCGNNVIEDNEECDGTNLNSQTCITQGFDSGTLTCDSQCLFDTSSCMEEPLVINCTDTDAGIDYYLEGVCTDSSGNFTDFYSGNALIEYYCFENQCESGQPFVCEQGVGNACLIINDLNDTGGGGNSATGCSQLNGEELAIPVSAGTRTTEDGIVQYCNPFTLEFDVAKEIAESCNENYECNSNNCESGVCIAITEQLDEQKQMLIEQSSMLKRIWCGVLHPIDALNRDDDGEDVSNNNWWACVISEGGDCSDTCDTFGYECGVRNICNASVECGTCEYPLWCGSLACEGISPLMWLGQYLEILKSCDNTGSCTNNSGVGSTIYSMAVYNNKLWLGHHNGDLQSCNEMGNCINHGDKGYNIYSMAVYNNKLWLGDSEGNLQSCDTTGNCINHGDKGDKIQAINVYDGKLWIGQRGGNLQSCNTTGNCTNQGDKGNNINTMAVYNNKLWLGHEAGGLQSCDTTGNCINHGDKGNNIESMAVFPEE